MKIQASLPLQQVEGVRGSGKGARGKASDAAGDRVRLSSEARFIQDLRDAAGALPEVRGDAVAQARADIASGTLGTPDDIEATIDGILAGF